MISQNQSLAVYGAGAFGSALASVQASNGSRVRLIARNSESADRIRSNRRSARGDIELSKHIEIAEEPAAAKGSSAILVAVPAQATRAALAALSPHIAGIPVVLCAKGLEEGTLARQSQIALEETRDRCAVAILTGPSFAKEMAAGQPTALTLACRDTGLGTRLQHDLSTPSMRLYLSDDVVGAEMGGALKNVIAIACGAVIGHGLGESARAALMTRGFSEILRISTAFGARPETVSGLSGLGDLALTCSSPVSRNFSFGRALGSGQPLSALQDDGKTYEGQFSAAVASILAKEKGVDAPICDAVTAVVSGRTNVGSAVSDLLARPLKSEV